MIIRKNLSFSDLFADSGGEEFVKDSLRGTLNLQKGGEELIQFQKFGLHKAARVISESEIWKHRWNELRPDFNITPTPEWIEYVKRYKNLHNSLDWFHHMLPDVPDFNDSVEYKNLVKAYSYNKGRFTIDPANKVFETLTGYFHYYVEIMEQMYENMLVKHTLGGALLNIEYPNIV